jgi:hypothetical protein
MNKIMSHTNFKARATALATLGVLGAGALLQPAPAHAADKEKLYKGGAVALGVLGAYYIVKGKTIPGAIAGAGAYYAYKKGKDADNDNDRYRDRYNDRNRSSRNNDFRIGDILNRGNRNDNRRNDDYQYPDYRDNDYRRDDNRYPDYSLR